VYPRLSKKKTPPRPDLGLLTIEELAARWGTKSLRVARSRAKAGGIPVIRLSPTTIRFRLSDVLQFEESIADKAVLMAGVEAMLRAKAAQKEAK
jgi:hypothetical protein